MAKAHELSVDGRTLDISIDEDITFSDMQLSERVLRGLKFAGFVKPSPIQRQAIPYGRCGYDLIIQAKSGTGKTCVYSVIALEMLEPSLKKIQVIIMAPTREISVQVKNVISSLGKFLGDVKIEAFIGGLPFQKDKKKINKCQIAVGAPGRVKHLISEGLMEVDSVRLFILDEADRLMEDSFRSDISYIFSKLPLNKQLIAVSATFPEELEKFVAEFMNKPMRICPSVDPVLVGVRQFVYLIPDGQSVLCRLNNKFEALLRTLSGLPFKQCFVFTNLQSWAESICGRVTDRGFSAAFINGGLTQGERLATLKNFKESRVRILFSTDLTARGIDCENVDLVVSLDLPYDCATYLHRIGRAGRYGSYGKAVTIIQEGPEVEKFKELLYKVSDSRFSVYRFPTEEVFLNSWERRVDKVKELSCLFGEGRSELKKALEEFSRKKDDQTSMTPEKAADVLYKFRLQAPKNYVSKTWDSLTSDLAKFQIADLETPPSECESSGIAPVPDRVLRSMLVLENNGWDDLSREFQAGKVENPVETASIATEVSSASDVVGLRSYPGEEEEAEEEEDEVEDEDEEEEEEEEEEVEEEDEEDEEDVEDEEDEDEVVNEIENENVNEDLDVDGTDSTEDDSEGSMLCCETAGSRQMNEVVRETVHGVNSGYNEIVHSWLTMWMNQCRAVSSYIQCYTYWMNMSNNQ